VAPSRAAFLGCLLWGSAVAIFSLSRRLHQPSAAYDLEAGIQGGSSGSSSTNYAARGVHRQLSLGGRWQDWSLCSQHSSQHNNTTASHPAGLTISQVGAHIPQNYIYMQGRWNLTQHSWALALAWLRLKEPLTVSELCSAARTEARAKQRVLLYPGFFLNVGLTGLNGLPQGEHIQWHDLYVSLRLLGYDPTLQSTRTKFTPELFASYDMIITDYVGVWHAMPGGVAGAARHPQRCKFRILDSYGTDDAYNIRDGPGPYCCMHLHLQQFWSFMPGYSPGNDFLGYATPRAFVPVSDFQSELEGGQVVAETLQQKQGQQQIQGPRKQQQQAGAARAFEIVLYGKEYEFFKNDHSYIQELLQFAPVHATAMGWPTDSPLKGVNNHGVLSHQALHKLMSRTFAYAGFPSVLMGPAAIEAISQGMIFLNYGLSPPWNLSARQDKPTTQLWNSQFPFLEPFEPHVLTVDPTNTTSLQMQLAKLHDTYDRFWGTGSRGSTNQQQHHQQLPPDDAQVEGHVLLAKTRGHRIGFVPREYTPVGMLLRVEALLQKNFC
jgi:hypothetical protein